MVIDHQLECQSQTFSIHQHARLASVSNRDKNDCITWVSLCSCFEAGNQVNRDVRICPILGDPGSKVDSVRPVPMIGHHDIAQVLALQAAAPPGSNQGVYLCPRVDRDQCHCACIVLGNNQHCITDCDQCHCACIVLGNNQQCITGNFWRQKWHKAGHSRQEDVSQSRSLKRCHSCFVEISGSMTTYTSTC